MRGALKTDFVPTVERLEKQVDSREPNSSLRRDLRGGGQTSDEPESETNASGHLRQRRPQQSPQLFGFEQGAENFGRADLCRDFRRSGNVGLFEYYAGRRKA